MLLTLGAAAGLHWLGWLPDQQVPAAPLHLRTDVEAPLEPRAPQLAPEEAPARVTGRLLDRLGRPLAGGEVRHLVSGEIVRTDEHGRFELSASPRRTHRLLLQAEGHDARIVQFVPEVRAAEPAFVLPDAQPWRVRRSLVTSAVTTPLAGEGYVRGPDAQGIQDAVVTLRETGVAVLTDETGRFRIPLPDGPFHLLAHDGEGRFTETEVLAPSRRQGLVPLPELQLREPGAVVRGRVRDEEGNPCAGAVIVVTQGSITRRAVTDEGGAFQIAGLPGGECALRTLPQPDLPALEHAVIAGASTDLELTLRRAKPWQVRVVDRAGKAQTSRLVIAGGSDRYTQAQALTDAEGRAVLHGLTTEPTEFEVRDADTFEALPIVGSDPATRTVTIR